MTTMAKENPTRSIGLLSLAGILCACFAAPAQGGLRFVDLEEAMHHGGVTLSGFPLDLGDCTYAFTATRTDGAVTELSSGTVIQNGVMPFGRNRCQPNPQCCDDNPGNNQDGGSDSASVSTNVQASRTHSGTIGSSLTVSSGVKVGAGIGFEASAEVASSISSSFSVGNATTHSQTVSQTIVFPSCFVKEGLAWADEIEGAVFGMTHSYSVTLVMGDAIGHLCPFAGAEFVDSGSVQSFIQSDNWTSFEPQASYRVDRPCNPNNPQDCPCNNTGGGTP
mgnify:CR=1 FL=1